jgi:hypothetical protein
VDRKRETPSLLVNEVLPMSEAVGKLTTAVALKLDPTRHKEADVAQLDPLLKRHKGNVDVFLQVALSPTQRVMMRLDRERSVRATPELRDDLELLLGPGCAQFCGAGTRRKKLKEERQQALFKEQEAAEETGAADAPPRLDLSSDEMAVQAMDEETIEA